jgi:glycosyltransferase involved in cell wall biosynthesis
MSAIDIIIPAFNASATISAAVRSGQRIAGGRVLVVDDGSTDQTAALAESLGATVLRQENSGASKARENGVAHSAAEFIIFLDADDEIVPNGVRRSLDLLTAQPQTAVAAGRAIGIRPSGAENLLPRRYASVEARTLLEIGVGPWPPAASVIRRAALEAANALPIASLHTPYAEDYEMIIRLTLVGTVSLHDAVAARYRLFDGKSSLAAERALRDKERIRAYYANSLGISVSLMDEPSIRTGARMRNARIAWAQGRRLPAIALAMRALGCNPTYTAQKLLDRWNASR